MKRKKTSLTLDPALTDALKATLTYGQEMNVAIEEGIRLYLLKLNGGQTAEPIKSNAAPSAYAPENKRLHDMLEEVLNSGDDPTIRAVVPNIEIFHERLKPRPIAGRRKAG